MASQRPGCRAPEDPVVSRDGQHLLPLVLWAQSTGLSDGRVCRAEDRNVGDSLLCSVGHSCSGPSQPPCGSCHLHLIRKTLKPRQPEQRNGDLTGEMAALPKEPGTSCELGRPKSLAALLLLSPTVKP